MGVIAGNANNMPAINLASERGKSSSSDPDQVLLSKLTLMVFIGGIAGSFLIVVLACTLVYHACDPFLRHKHVTSLIPWKINKFANKTCFLLWCAQTKKLREFRAISNIKSMEQTSLLVSCLIWIFATAERFLVLSALWDLPRKCDRLLRDAVWPHLLRRVSRQPHLQLLRLRLLPESHPHETKIQQHLGLWMF